TYEQRSLAVRETYSRVADQRIHVAIVCQVVVGCMERSPLHPGVKELLLVGCQLLLPTAVADNHLMCHPGRVRHELRKQRRPPVTRAIEAVNQTARLLKLYRQEVSSADIDRAPLHAVEVVAATNDLITPEV